MSYITVQPLSGLLLLIVAANAGCRSMQDRWFEPPGPVAPVVIQGPPTAAQIIAAVNQNTDRVQTYYTTTAKFTVPGMGVGLPLLRGTIAYERPRNFRLTAGIALTGGTEVDLGSNSELFWFWVKQNEPPALYYCRHDQYVNSAARQILPIDPTWIGDALGLVQLNPSANYAGPVERPDGTLEIRSTISTPTGPMQRALVVDATRAWVLEQHLYKTSGGPPVASAVAEDFRYDETARVSLPRKVTIRVPASELTLTIDVGRVAINQGIPNAALMWSPPAAEGYPRVDLGSTPAGVAFDKSAIPSTHIPAIPTATAVSPRQVPPVSAYAQPATPGKIEPVHYEAPTPMVHQLPRGGIALDRVPTVP